MKTMFASAVCFSLIALVGAAAGGDKAAAKLDGTWIATGGSSEGKEIPAEFIEKIMLTVVMKDGKYTVSVAGQEAETGTYKADPGKKPATLDVEISTGKNEGKKQFGIYKLDDDKLTLVMSKAGSQDRPKTFDATEGVDITIMKRKK
jgi:uncharacterized protein (TIGR03067 family)